MNPENYQQPVYSQPPEYQTGSDAQKHHRFNWWMFGSILMTVLFIAALGFGIWAFMERNRYRDETQTIVDQAVAEAVDQNTEELEAQFVEREKQPLTSYTGPTPLGSINIQYPKTWSVFINEAGGSSRPLEGHFHPNFVPAEAMDVPYALYFSVVDSPFEREVARFDSDVRRGRLESRPINLEKVDGVTGTRLDGQISRDREGSVVLFPLRDKTLILVAEATQYRSDFNNIILSNLEFNP